MQTKSFPVRVVLTSTTGRLLTEGKGDRDNGIGDLYEFLWWMTGDSPFTHQLGRFSEECNPWLLRWFPELSGVSKKHLDALDAGFASAESEGFTLSTKGAEAIIKRWLDWVIAECGLKAEYDVPKIPRDDHAFKDPVQELIEIRGTDEGVIAIDPGDHVDDLDPYQRLHALPNPDFDLDTEV